MRFDTKKLVTAAVIGAAYAALTMINPLAYGPIQFRVSEVLCILPFFLPFSAVGLTIGCAIANLIGPYGIIDIVFGSLATLLAGVCTALIGIRARRSGKTEWGTCVVACLMPVVFNAVIVGTVLAYASLTTDALDGLFWRTAAVYGGQVGLGEAGVMFVLGLPALRYILKSPALGGLLDRQR